MDSQYIAWQLLRDNILRSDSVRVSPMSTIAILRYCMNADIARVDQFGERRIPMSHRNHVFFLSVLWYSVLYARNVSRRRVLKGIAMPSLSPAPPSHRLRGIARDAQEVRIGPVSNVHGMYIT